MVSFSGSDDLRGAEFVDVSLRGARLTECDLSGLVARGIFLDGAEIDAPWLFEGGVRLLVNGVDVVPLVAAELDRRFPGRAQRRAPDVDGLRAAWTALEAAWASVLERAAAMPEGTVDVSVAGEWSLTQTLRHLVFATDVWLGMTVVGAAEPFHPLGLAGSGTDVDRLGGAEFTTGTPSYADVLAAREGRVALVRDFIAAVTPAELGATHTSPWDPDHQETTLSCLHVILEEEWEHLRFATRDLDALG